MYGKILALALALPLCGCFVPAALTSTPGIAVSSAAAGAGTVLTAQQAMATANVVLPQAFLLGCAAVSTAEGTFEAMAPALVVQGHLTQAQVDQQKALFTVDQNRCDHPPADVTQIIPDLMADAAAKYVLIALPPPAAAAH